MGAAAGVAAAAESPQARSRPDLRLVPVLAASWAAAGWATAARSGHVVVAAAACLLLGAGFAVRSSGISGRWRPTAVFAMAAVGLVLAATAAQTIVRTRGPLPEWIVERAVVAAEGVVLGDPHRVMRDPAPSFASATRAPAAGRGPSAARYTIRIRLERVEARGRRATAAAPVLVVAGAEWADLSAGQRISLTARLDPTEPGDDVVALARAMGPPRDVRPGGLLWRLADRLRAGLREACSGLPADAAGLLPSLVVGDTSRLPDALRADLQTASLTHLTAVSGANVAIVAGAALWAATALGVRRSVRLLLAVALVACFVVVARPQPSVLRAAVMGAVALLGLGMSRRPRGLPALAAAATALLVVDPWLARSAGFALSCLATAALLLLAPAWARRLARWMPLPVAAAIAVPAAAQAACGPVVILLSPSVSVVAVPANLLAGPAVAPATISGVLAAVIAPLSPALAHACAWAGGLATSWIARVAHVGAGMPFAGLPWPAGVRGAALLAVLTAILVLTSLIGNAPRAHRDPGEGLRPAGSRRSPPAARRPGQRLPAGWIAALALVLLAAAVAGWLVGPRLPLPWTPLPWPGRSWPPAGWAVVQCDVGQGAATVVRSGPDRGVLIDVGPVPDAVDRCLQRLGVRHLDLVVLTHHHADHVDGLPGALRRRDATAILVSPLAEPREAAAAVRRTAEGAGVPVAQGWAGMSGEAAAGGWVVRWRLLAPAEPPAPISHGDQGEGTEVNESSLVTVVEVDGAAPVLRVIGFGDLEIAGQERLLRRLVAGQADAGGPVDVLVVAHHGSSKQVPELCRVLAPRVAVIGVGADNDYGHPAPSALRMLRECGAPAYRTDLSGHVAFVSRPDGGLVTMTERRPTGGTEPSGRAAGRCPLIALRSSGRCRIIRDLGRGWELSRTSDAATVLLQRWADRGVAR